MMVPRVYMYTGFTKRQAEVVVQIVVAGMEDSTIRSTSLVRAFSLCVCVVLDATDRFFLVDLPLPMHE